MAIGTSRAAMLAAYLVVQLLGGLTPAHVLCLHHDGAVTIERAARGAVRCVDLEGPCTAAGLVPAPDDHCHDAAIAQPGLGQRGAAPAAVAALVMILAEPAHAYPISASHELVSQRGSPTSARRTIVLRV